MHCKWLCKYLQILMSVSTDQLLIVLNSVLILLVVMSVIAMMATEQLLLMLHDVKVGTCVRK